MNNDLDLTPFPTFDEFSVGQMLPQCGSTLGMSSDDESIEDLIDKDNHMFIQEDSKKNILDSFKEKELTKSDIFYFKKEHKKLQELKGREKVIGYYDGKNLIAFYIIEDRNNYTYLKTIWVDEKYRQKGIASKIMEKIKEENNDIETNVEDDNEYGKKLVDKHGFRRRGSDKYGNIMVYKGNKKSEPVKESALSTKERNRLDDSFFGLPTQRKYPMPDKKHVLLAIKFFNQCPSKHKKELSININNRINELFSEEEKKKINIGNTNTFLKYYNTNESALININEGYFSELEIQIQDSGCNIIEDYVFNNKPTQQGFIKGSTWNSLLIYNGKRYRERVEALILDDHNHIFLAFKDKDRLKYKIPGGSSEKNQTLMQQLQDECNEEAKIYIKDIKYIFTYTKPYKNSNDKYDGYFAHIFVAKYNGKYLKPVKEKDLDLTILNNGRFYDITDIFDKLTPIHKAALLQSNQLK